MSGYFEQWKDRFGKTDAQLAEYIGTTVNRLPGIAAELVQANPSPGPVCRDAVHLSIIAERHGADFRRLADVVATEMHPTINPAARPIPLDWNSGSRTTRGR